MSKNFLEISPAELPATLPIFPLNGVLLMPRCHLPLNIFEPRYLHMVLDALGNKRLIGLVQPISSRADEEDEQPTLYRVGCLGKITQFEETKDGRLQIVLQGITRFEMEDELPLSYRGYRMAMVKYGEYAQDFLPDEGKGVPRDKLIQQVVDYASFKQLELERKSIETIPTHLLVDVLSMTLPFGTHDKQALVESPHLDDRARVLMGLMTMEMMGGDKLGLNMSNDSVKQ
jgi:Lon protease-like protein